MAELINTKTRKAIKKMAEVSHLNKALALMPTPEKFALTLIGDMRNIAKTINNISIRLNDLMERYNNIPVEFLLEGFDEVLDKLNKISGGAKLVINETSEVLTSSVKSVKDLSGALGSAVSATSSAVLQIGGGLAYSSVSIGNDIKLAMTGSGKRSIEKDVVKDVVDNNVSVGEITEEISERIYDTHVESKETADNIKESTKNAAKNVTESIDGFFEDIDEGLGNVVEAIEDKKESAEKLVDNSVGYLIEKVKAAKQKVEDKINSVKEIFNKLNKQFEDVFGIAISKDVSAAFFENISNNAKDINSPTFDAVSDLSKEVKIFIENFNIGKIVTGLGGLFVSAGAATLAMDLLPNIDVDKMLKNIIGGINEKNAERESQMKYLNNRNGVDMYSVPDFPWQLSIDDLEKYNADGYNDFLEQYVEDNDNERSDIMQKFMNAKSRADYDCVLKENKDKMKENKSALNALRKVRRDAIKARQIERYKHFLSIELSFLKDEFRNVGNKIKSDWDIMMDQYKIAIAEIKRFFNEGGSGGNEKIDRCCDIINDDADQIVELCKNISVELTNTVSMVPTPYSIGPCVDMPAHKILSFFKDVKIILTFLKEIIRLGMDIIVQISILSKIISSEFQSLKEIMDTLKKLIGIDEILKMIDAILALFRQKMADGKILLENSLTPIYYNETEDFEARVEALEALLEDDVEGGNVEKFKYTDDAYAKKKYRKTFGGEIKDDDEIEDILEELESKGDREIVAYRSPILNDTGDDFAGWIFYHAYAYDNMKKGWSSRKKRRRNKLIKKASRKNKMRNGVLVGGVSQLKKYNRFGKYNKGKYIRNSVTGYQAYYWYTKWTNDPTDCEVDMSNEGKDIVVPIQTTSNGSLVELSDGRRVFVDGKIVKSGDFVNVDGVKYRVK
mgnify:CR=1 FL=1